MYLKANNQTTRKYDWGQQQSKWKCKCPTLFMKENLKQKQR